MAEARPKTDNCNAHVPFSMVLASVAGLWLCYFLLTSLRAEILDIGFAWEFMWRRAIASLLGALITLALWLVLRAFDARPLGAKIAAALLASLPVALLIAQVNQLVFASMEDRVFTRVAEQLGFGVRRSSTGDLLVDIPSVAVPAAVAGEVPANGPPAAPVTISASSLQGPRWQQLTEVAFGRYFMMLTWCALYLALLTGEKARAAERREGTYRRAAKAAELRSLRYQVNPHFLFNTLNSLSALVLTGKTVAAERMIQTISTFYRRSLADDPTSDVPLVEEFALQKLYLEVEMVRFPQRLKVRYDLPPQLEQMLVPGMILQPLVENSVKHAVAPTAGQVTISITAREEEGQLVIEVADNGGGKEAARGLTQPGHGIGLANVRDRLAARFGTDAQLISGRTGAGYAALLRLPLVYHAEARS